MRLAHEINNPLEAATNLLYLLSSQGFVRFGGGQKLHLTIADDGSGIRVGHLKRIFEPFFTTKEAYGTGLGLWVTRELVRKHNGTIKVRSRSGSRNSFPTKLPGIANGRR